MQKEKEEECKRSVNCKKRPSKESTKFDECKTKAEDQAKSEDDEKPDQQQEANNDDKAGNDRDGEGPLPPSPSPGAPLPAHLLVLGSSVAAGEGASLPTTLGWTYRVADMGRCSSVENLAKGGTTTEYWLQGLTLGTNESGGSGEACGLLRQEVEQSSWQNSSSSSRLLIFSLSLGNEGLARMTSHEDADIMASNFVAASLRIVEELMVIAKASNRVDSSTPSPTTIAMCGPYPNGSYSSDFHYHYLKRSNDEMRAAIAKLDSDSTSTVQDSNSTSDSSTSNISVRLLFIDFLQNDQLGAGGRWHSAYEKDPGHPNDAGHGVMAQLFCEQYSSFQGACD
eukprot:gnl/TRDRNA2_/TRDRNA2_189446_c0_seq1.p1 gnl/TRDRNA2_/TRDRNA2_189446_c0~~gnl/TRDRNA2_/TRDRNA2_189446_c0_seq1.p1  ORF type:complete len:339 (-),score=40.06 gnl/TRDRNA2_/TRDRNA2_189446_c0_seq1:290-1306(-)